MASSTMTNTIEAIVISMSHVCGSPAMGDDDGLSSRSWGGISGNYKFQNINNKLHKRFYALGDIKKFLVRMARSDELKADRQARRARTRRHGERGKSCQVDRDRIDIGKVHFKRTVAPASQGKRGRRRRGAGDYIHPLKDLDKIIRDEPPHFLRLEIVRVVVSCRERVGTEHNAPLYFYPKPFVP